MRKRELESVELKLELELKPEPGPARTKAFNKCNTITCSICLEEEQQQQHLQQLLLQQQEQPVGQGNNSIGLAYCCLLPVACCLLGAFASFSELLIVDSVVVRALLHFLARSLARSLAPRKSLNAAHVIFLSFAG